MRRVALTLALALSFGAASCDDGGTTSTGTTSSSSAGGAASTSSGGVDECATNVAVCDEHATCADTPDWYTCTCNPGFEGDGATCADVDECQTLLSDCDPHATCTNTEGSFTCACPDGFTGDGKACAATYDDVAAGAFHACALRTDGTLWCWGLDTSGQIGTGSTDPIFLRPTQAGTASNWALVRAGGSSTCGLDDDAKIACWGAGTSGQVGDGTTTSKFIPTPVVPPMDVVGWKALDVGANHACAIATGGTTDGGIYCWGANARGQLGDTTTTTRTTPTGPVAGGKWESVATGSEFTCAVAADHTLWCWGLDTSRQLGDNSVTNKSAPVQEASGASDWVSVTAANAWACGTKTDGTRWCWGANAVGQAGNGTIVAIATPTQIDPGATDWKTVDGGDFAGCGLRGVGELWCWGDGSQGQTGQPGNESILTTATRVGADEDWKHVASGQRFACGVRVDGRVRCWGAASQGAIGLGYTSDRSAPDAIGDDPTWVSVAAQLDSACAIDAAGALFCWGRNAFGEVGDGTVVSKAAPAPIAAGTTWKAVAAGRLHTCGISTSGGTDTIQCWGSDADGQQGNGAASTAAQPTPAPVTAPAGFPTTWQSIASGFNHACAIGGNGTLWCWGRNASAQLGDGSTTARPQPVQIAAPSTDWKEISASGDLTCGRRGAGTLWCWGLNSSGQVGQGDTASPVTTPTQIGTAQYVSVSAGATHACAVDKGGKLFCWGTNTSFQLGLGDTSTHLAPFQVGVATDWGLAKVGQGTFSCAEKSSGELYCFGSNGFGQLGLGTIATAKVPTLVPSLTTWGAIAVGVDHACGVDEGGKLACWGGSYAAQLGSGVPFVSTPTQIVEPL